MISSIAKAMISILLLTALLSFPAPAQEGDSFRKEDFYMDSGQRLLIEVHIWGEVNSPGMYRIPDGSTVLDLISKAGGPTQYAALSRVKLSTSLEKQRHNSSINIDRYLNTTKGVEIPVLKPGDKVMIPRNARFFWKDAVRLVADLAVIVNVYYLISRNK